MRSVFIAATFVVAAALPFPICAGAKSMQELPAGHWAYAAVAELTSVGLLQQLHETALAPAHTRTRYELALTIRKAQAALDAATFAAPAPELPAAVRVPLRLKGTGQQLAVLEEAYVAMTQKGQLTESERKACDILSAELPAARSDLAALTVEVNAEPGGMAKAQRVYDLEKRLDSLLSRIQAVKKQIGALAPAILAAAGEDMAPSTLTTLTNSIDDVADPGAARKRAAEALDKLAALQKEFAVELSALYPTQYIAVHPTLAQLLPDTDQVTPPAPLNGSWRPPTPPVSAPATVRQKSIAPSAGLDRLYGADLKIGADYSFDLFGASLHTGLEMQGNENADSLTLTKRVSARAPLGDIASVSARVELVDIDRLRNLTHDDSAQTKFGVDGSVRLGDAGSLRIGYELTRTQNPSGPTISAAADAGVEYNITDRARVAAGFNVNADQQGAKATTNLDVGYNITRNSSLSARYELVNFADSGDFHRANIAQARLSLRF